MIHKCDTCGADVRVVKYSYPYHRCEPIYTHEKFDKLVTALEKIKEREKPDPGNDPLGMGIVGDSYKIARDALKEYQGEK